LIRYRDIADRIDVEAVENELGFDLIESDGEEDRGYCFDVYGMHKNGDTTGKLSINRNKRVFHCWVCGGGSILKLVQDVKQLDENNAVEWLTQFATSAASDDRFLEELDEMFVQEVRDTTMPFFNEKVLDRFEDEHPWFAERGISEQICREFRLGYDPHSNRGGSIILPHFWEGKLVGWQRRFLDNQKPKYTNTDRFPREETLFGMDHVDGCPIVVESPVTALYLYSNGHSAVATFGSEVTEEQCRLLRRYPALTLAPDNDKVGRKWLTSLTTSLDRFTNIYIAPYVTTKEGSDLADVPKGQLEYYLRRAKRAW
jgi:DNA primase